MLPLFLLLALSWTAPISYAAPPAAAVESGFPGGLKPPQLQKLLQRFVDKLYLKAFRHLGDERDFDHGHILFSLSSNKPVAILYHTQETAWDQPKSSAFGYVDPGGRNWIQWIGQNKIENADGYLRKNYPSSASWRWFEKMRLPALMQHHTIIDKMLDPSLLGVETTKNLQWVFTRFDCAKQPPTTPISIHLPTGELVCLALSTS